MKISFLSLLFALGILLCSCSPRLPSEYLHNFYNDRQEQMIHLISGERAPLQSNDLTHIQHFPYQNTYRVKAKFTPTPNALPFDMSTISGQTKEFIKVGRLNFTLDQQQSQIHVYQEVRYMKHPIYGNYYFIPFNDDSNANETYGGGRYIDMKKSLFDSKHVILDFNKAYNPWCAYADGYNCPIPPAENYQAISILAGEKSFAKEIPH